MTAVALPGAAAPDRYRFKYLIAITVSLASVLELLDTSIVNVAIPHMMGNLGATLDQVAWVSTGYIVANVIVLPITGWLSAYFGRRNYFAGSIALFTLSFTAASCLESACDQGSGSVRPAAPTLVGFFTQNTDHANGGSVCLAVVWSSLAVMGHPCLRAIAGEGSTTARPAF